MTKPILRPGQIWMGASERANKYRAQWFRLKIVTVGSVDPQEPDRLPVQYRYVDLWRHINIGAPEEVARLSELFDLASAEGTWPYLNWVGRIGRFSTPSGTILQTLLWDPP